MKRRREASWASRIIIVKKNPESGIEILSRQQDAIAGDCRISASAAVSKRQRFGVRGLRSSG